MQIIKNDSTFGSLFQSVASKAKSLLSTGFPLFVSVT